MEADPNTDSGTEAGSGTTPNPPATGSGAPSGDQGNDTSALEARLRGMQGLKDKAEQDLQRALALVATLQQQVAGLQKQVQTEREAGAQSLSTATGESGQLKADNESLKARLARYEFFEKPENKDLAGLKGLVPETVRAEDLAAWADGIRKVMPEVARTGLQQAVQGAGGTPTPVGTKPAPQLSQDQQLSALQEKVKNARTIPEKQAAQDELYQALRAKYEKPKAAA